jgi:hypothetical protein
MSMTTHSDESMVGNSSISNTKETGKVSGAESCPDTDFGKGSNSAPASGGYKPETGYQKG